MKKRVRYIPRIPVHRLFAERYGRMVLRASRARGIVREAIKASMQPQSLDMRLLGWAHVRAERKLKQLPAMPARVITIGLLLAILMVPSHHVKMILVFVLPFASILISLPLAGLIAHLLGEPDIVLRQEYDRLRAKYAERLAAEEAQSAALAEGLGGSC